MWPGSLPSWILNDERRAAEVSVYRRLQEVLGDEWSVFYSRPWMGLNERGGEIDGEADFIIAAADAGFLFIEVKGGRVAYEPAGSGWISTDRHEIPRSIKDPIGQALGCKHQFLKRLRKMDGWPNAYVRFRHGAVLPDSSEPSHSVLTLGGHDKHLFCFANRFDSDLHGWIAERLADHDATVKGKEVPPGQSGLELLTKLVADPVRLRVPLRREIQADMSHIDQLATGAQMHIINLLETIPRALIEGGAGTGKTILAVETAARMADTGAKVCVLCYNEPLAVHIRELLRSRPAVTVETFHAMCGQLCKEAGIDPGPTGRDFFEEVLPRCAAMALERLPARRWDAVIVDEGQDFTDTWWAVVDRMPVAEKGLLRVFSDANQALYADPRHLAERLRAQTFPLRNNLRNTKPIAKVTDRLYKGPLIAAAGPEGEAPVAEHGAFSGVIEAAINRVLHLVRDEGVRRGDIAVLCPTDQTAKRVQTGLTQLKLAWSAAHQRSTDRLTVDTIRRFKGLEAPIIVLALDRFAADNRELAYVGVSRAQSRLFVIGELNGTLTGSALNPDGK